MIYIIYCVGLLIHIFLVIPYLIAHNYKIDIVFYIYGVILWPLVIPGFILVMIGIKVYKLSKLLFNKSVKTNRSRI